MSDMRFGICMSYRDRQRQLEGKQAGADYCEPSFRELAVDNNDSINQYKELIQEIDLPCEAANGMFPGEIHLVGPDVDYGRIDEFVDRGAENFASLGGKVVVFGSGGARRCPDGFDKAKAYEQLNFVCSEHIAPWMKKHGLVCVIEPLRTQECNMVYNSKIAFDICRAVNKPEIQLLIDLFHFRSEKEPLERLREYQGWVRHVHIASVMNDRLVPQADDGEYYADFFAMLREIGYAEKRISLEGRYKDFNADAKSSLAYLRTL